MARLPTVSAMFLTRGRPQLIERALLAVLADPALSEAIVVIDGEDPATSVALGRIAEQDPRVKLSSTPPPRPDGLDRVQRGRDHGVELADSEVILSLDDDVIAHPGLVEGHARRHAEGDADLVVVGYMPVVTPARWPRSHAPVRFYAEAYESHCDEFAADRHSILRNLWAGNISIRRATWLQAIDAPRVSTYHDDQELGLLLERSGAQATFDRSLRGDHHYERNLRGFAVRAERTTEATAQLRAAFPESLPAPEPLHPRPEIRALLFLSRSAAGWFAIRWGLIGATATAAALRITGMEELFARALWRIATERAQRGLSNPSSAGGVE